MIYFHAGDKYQFQKYGMTRSRLLSYPNKPKLSKKYRIFNKANLDTTYKTFEYIFEHLKKGVYISIKDNELFTFFPFNNINYMKKILF